MKLKLISIAAATATAMAAGALTVSVPAQADPVCENERTVAPGSIYTGTKKQEEYCELVKEPPAETPA